jgi:multidrug efflux pump
LPEDADEPTINEVNLSLAPVLIITVSGDVSERELLKRARTLRDEIQSIDSVLEAAITGSRDELLEVVIDPVSLESYDLDASEVISIFSRSNRLVAAGNLDNGRGRFPIKVPGLFETAADILNQPVKVNGDAVVRLRDIGSVRRVFKDRTNIARLDGQPALALQVSKRLGENIIQTNQKIRAVVNAEIATWPDSLKVTFSQDQSNFVLTMLSDLENNVMSAILLVMIIIIGALGVSSAGLVGLAIPGSFLLGILALSNLGLTMNMVVLFALILAVGMLVDGAIVVTEQADRNMREGARRRDAYINAAHRMSWPIISSTATTLAAFMPLVFWPGIVGEFMKFLPITLIATLSASLLMALIFIPTIGAQIGRTTQTAKTIAKTIANGAGTAPTIGVVTAGYIDLMQQVLKHPFKVLVAAAMTLVAVQITYQTYGKGTSFFPDTEPENAKVFVHARGNLAIQEQLQLVLKVEEEIRAIDAFKSVFLVVGSQTGGAQQTAEDVIGNFTLDFKPWDQRDQTADQILAKIRKRAEKYAGITVDTKYESAGPPTGKDLQLLLKSQNPELLPAVVAAARAKFETMDGLINIEDERDIPGIEWRIAIDRDQAAKFGVDVTVLGQYVRLITNGMKFTDYRPYDSDEEIDIVARYPEKYRNLMQFNNIRIRTPSGLVPINSFIEKQAHSKVGKIRRIDGRRAMKVLADVEMGLLVSDKVTEIRSWLDAQSLPAGVSYEFSGEDEEQSKAEAFLVNAFGIALFVMAIILVTQFNSFYSAFLILSAVIMSTVGVFIGLLITNEPFDIVMTGIGVIALAGIVVNNNIVLIDTFDHFKRQRLQEQAGAWTAEDGFETVIKTGAQRLRPVLLTTCTTILGLVPMVMQTNIDFVTREVSVGAPSTQLWVSLATAIVFGLLFATILTLVVTPSALMVREILLDWRQDWR